MSAVTGAVRQQGLIDVGAPASLQVVPQIVQHGYQVDRTTVKPQQPGDSSLREHGFACRFAGTDLATARIARIEPVLDVHLDAEALLQRDDAQVLVTITGTLREATTDGLVLALPPGLAFLKAEFPAIPTIAQKAEQLAEQSTKNGPANRD